MTHRFATDEECTPHNLHCLKELAKVSPEALTADYASWWLNAERLLNERFRTSLPEARYGDRVNLWQQMLFAPPA